MTELYWQPGQHLSAASTLVNGLGLPGHSAGVGEPKGEGPLVVAARPASSPRIDRLEVLRGGAATTLFSLRVPRMADYGAFARMLTALVDSFESFWEDSEILLHLGCAAGDGGRIAAALPRISRLRADVFEELPATSRGPGPRKNRKAHGEERARLMTDAGSAADLICLLDMGVFPIRPLSTRSLLERSIDGQRRAAGGVVSLLRPLHLANPAGVPSNAGTVEASVKSLTCSQAGSVPTDTASGPSGVSLFLKEEMQAALAQSGMISPVDIVSAIDLASGRAAPPGHVSRRPFTVEIDGAACSAAYGRGWLRQPWTDPDAAFFMYVPDWHLTDVEVIVSHVYAALHR